MNRLASVLGHVLMALYRILEHLALLFVPRRYRYKSIEGEIALVTGGGSGIGRLVSSLLAQKGATVVVWDLDGNSAEETCRMIGEAGGRAHHYVCDVSSPAAVYATATKVRSEVGNVSLLVNNAGIVYGKKLMELSEEQIEKTMGVNALAHFWTTKAFLPDMMVKNKGHVVTIASMAGMLGLDRLTDYCASKHAALGFTEALIMELRSGGYDGIQVTAVCPFVINTGLFAGFNPGILPALKPEDVAEEIVSAVLINQRLLILPKHLTLMLVLKSVLPAESQFCMADVFDVNDMMKDFRGGRQKGAEKNEKNRQVTFKNGARQ